MNSLEIFKRTIKRYQCPILLGVASLFFSPKRYQFLHNKLFYVIFCRLNKLKGTSTAPAVDLVRLNTQPLKDTTSTPVIFKWKSPPGSVTVALLLRALAICRWGKKSVSTLQYGPRVRLVRGVHAMIAKPVFNLKKLETGSLGNVIQ